MNPAPDADRHSVGEANFDWIVNAVAELAVKYAQDSTKQEMEFHWAKFLAGGNTMAATKDVKAKAGAAVKKLAAKKATSGAAKKSQEKDEPLNVKAKAEDLKARNVKASRAGLNKKELPPRKNP